MNCHFFLPRRPGAPLHFPTPVRGVPGPCTRHSRARPWLLLLAAALLLPVGCAKSVPPERKAGAGMSYFNDVVPDVPWSIHVVKIERAQGDLEFIPTLARGQSIGLSPMSAQLRTIPRGLGQPVAAVNGDFYRTENESCPGDPRGLQIIQGELISAPTGPAFWIDAAGAPHLANIRSGFAVTLPDGSTLPCGLNEERGAQPVLYTSRFGPATQARGLELVLERHGTNAWLPLRAGTTNTARIREARPGGNSPLTRDTLVLALGSARGARLEAGATVTITTATTPDLAGARAAIGGGPILVQGGAVQKVTTNKSRERHPRSALGWNTQHYFLVQVDGRQSDLSVGMTLPELANYLVKLGCTEAMNLDGGGSSTLWLNGRVMNSPCYGHERPIANTLAVVRKPAAAPALAP